MIHNNTSAAVYVNKIDFTAKNFYKKSGVESDEMGVLDYMKRQ